MTDTISKVREHYSAVGLTDRIKAALATVMPETEALTVAQLAPLDQFHTRGILATAELARAARLDARHVRTDRRYQTPPTRPVAVLRLIRSMLPMTRSLVE